MKHLFNSKFLGFFLVGTVVLSACNPVASPPNSSPPSESPSSASASPSPVTQELEFTAVEDGQTALELTQAQAQVGLKEYDFGVMVEELNGLKADSSHYWALYVNDQYAQASADQTQLNKGDRVKWVYEELKKGL